MKIEKYKDQRDQLGTRTRSFYIVEADGTRFYSGRTDYARDLPPVEWVRNYDTNRDLHPGSKRFTRIMSACMEREDATTILRRPADVTARIEQLADV
ncbi:hypothetical protein [Corynebacterium riegelii]